MENGSEQTQREIPPDLTAGVNAFDSGVPDTLSQMVQANYSQLREIARLLMNRESEARTVQPTALVHEAFLRMIDGQRVTPHGVRAFKFIFARECRQILVDQARRRRAQRRGGKIVHEPMRESVPCPGVAHDVDLLDLHDALESLARLNERMARIVELRVFSGMTISECTSALQVSAKTVKQDWSFATRWLQAKLS